VGIGTDGTVSNPHALPGAALVSAAHAHGVKVHLGATLFNTGAGEISTFLGSTPAQNLAVQQLVALLSGIDGINLDFEFVSSGSRSAFTAFVQQLHTALRNANAAAELTLALPASTGYSGYDAVALAATTERLLLMEYDYHWRTAPTSGAVSPLPPVEQGVGTFLAVAPAASIAMGVPYYGYDWPTAGASPGATTLGGGTAIVFKTVFANFATYGRLWDSPSQTPWYRYMSGAQQRQAWVEDDQSLALKYQYVNSKNLAGIMIWALGYDGARTESWDAIKTAFGSGPPPPPTTPGLLHVVSVTFSPSTLDPGSAITATFHLKNVGGQTIAAVLPAPGRAYDEADAAPSAAQDTWRVAVDAADRPAAQPARPWRWGLSAPLAAGAEADLTGQVTLHRTGTRTLWAAAVHEGVDTPQDYLGQTDVYVTPPASPDAGTTDAGTPGSDAGTDAGVDPLTARAGGCTQAGSTPWALLLVLALGVRTRARRREAA
jgi:hypothetical protein